MRSRLIIVAAATVACLGLGPGTAGAVGFGADLNQAPNSPYTCPQATGIFPKATCTMFSGSPGPSFYAPISGVVNSVSVRVGPVTGPMQVLVMTSLYQNKAGDPGHPYFACCFVAQYGPTFTPAANNVTTVPTALSMIEQPTPAADDFTTNARGDFLALSVLDPNVPIPAVQDNASGFGIIGPAPTPANTPAPSPNPLTSAGSSGFHLSLAADISPNANPPGPVGTAPLRFDQGGNLIGSTARIPITCVLTTACDGALQLLSPARGASARRAANVAATSKVYGSKKFSIPAGKTRTIKVKLNKRGKRKLGRRKSLTVTAVATIGGQKYSSTVKLKKKKRR